MKRKIGIWIGLRVVRRALSRTVHSTPALVGALALGTGLGVLLSRLQKHRREANAFSPSASSAPNPIRAASPPNGTAQPGSTPTVSA